MASQQLTLTFYGGVGGVTGSNFVLAGDNFKFMVDCGLFQGGREQDDENYKPFSYNPAEITALIVTHAHLDHIGRIPKLVREGFSGAIYSTPATKDIAEAMFDDALSILAERAHRDNHPPLYTQDDVKRTSQLWKTAAYGVTTPLAGDVSLVFRDAGHILGSGMAEIVYRGKKIVFTGDLGNSPSPLLNDTEEVTDADYLVMESVYGDRNHETRDTRKDELEDAIENAVLWGGVLLIPVFSIERTQTLLYEVNKLVEGHEVPAVPVFVDSPLAIRVTEIYRKRIHELNVRVQEEVKKGDDIFAFPKLTFSRTAEESRMIARVGNPKIIIAGSGMSSGGRVLYHEKKYLPDPKCTLLLVGYQAAGTLGRQLAEGARSIQLHGEKVSVRARVVTLYGYSAHKDSDDLFSFAAQTADTVKKVFVVMGEAKSSLFLVQRLRDYLGIDARAPERGETVILPF